MGKAIATKTARETRRRAGAGRHSRGWELSSRLEMNAALSLSSADAEPQREGARGNKLAISIVVPVLNEAPLIVNSLRQLRARAADAEIIVVDGESSDATADVAAPLCDQLIRTSAGRARQMNAGAAAAHGEVLWFLHVDVEVPSGCLDDMAACLADPKIAGGFFRICLPRSALVYQIGRAHV